VGGEVGDLVGLVIGNLVGLVMGSNVGDLLGLVVGEEVGDSVGLDIGDEVGDLVGLVVGDEAGDSVGLVDLHTPPSQTPHGIELQRTPSGISVGSGQDPSPRQGPSSSQSFSLVHEQGVSLSTSLYVQKPL